jgi:hypothetical protein
MNRHTIKTTAEIIEDVENRFRAKEYSRWSRRGLTEAVRGAELLRTGIGVGGVRISKYSIDGPVRIFTPDATLGALKATGILVSVQADGYDAEDGDRYRLTPKGQRWLSSLMMEKGLL